MTVITRIGIDQPARYTITVQGRLTSDLCDWFLAAPEQTAGPGAGRLAVTTLAGIIADQAALHGLLKQIRDLGLVLLYLECLSAEIEPGKDLRVERELRNETNQEKEA